MSIYSELDIIISDYVGYNEEETKHGIEQYCADIDLYNMITEECNQYNEDPTVFEKLSDDTKYCINEWLTFLESYHSYKTERDHNERSLL